jgi:hypothetical protein
MRNIDSQPRDPPCISALAVRIFRSLKRYVEFFPTSQQFLRPLSCLSIGSHGNINERDRVKVFVASAIASIKPMVSFIRHLEVPGTGETGCFSET